MLSDNQFSKIQNDLTLYIGEEHLVVSAKAAFHPVKHLQIAIEKTAAENRLDDLSASLAKIDIALLKQHFALSNEAKILIVMSHQWLASCLLPWSKMMLKAKTAYEFAKQQLQNAGYTLHEDDTICIDDAPFGQARMALAYPAQLQTSLLQLLNRCHLKIIAQLPLSALLKEQLLSNATKNQAASAYVLLEPNFLSLAIYQKNQLQQ